jgi:predicted phosphoribosyltransferase
LAKFADLRAGGRALAESLAHYRGDASALVLGVARGGVPAAVEVARALELPVDVLVPRRLLASRGDGTSTSAIKIAGRLVVDPELERRLDEAGAGARAGIADLLSSLEARDALCRGSRPAVDMSARTVLLIDNGIHTGATALVAIRGLRSIGVGRVVVAAPAVAPSALAAVSSVADEVVTLAGSEPFGHVGMWYTRLDVPEYSEIASLLHIFTSSPTSHESTMLETLTHETFQPFVGQPFAVMVGSDRFMPTHLIEVRPLALDGDSRRKRSPFALVFRGPAGGHLPQDMYDLKSGDFELPGIFLVPLGPDADGMLYEAVFT